MQKKPRSDYEENSGESGMTASTFEQVSVKIDRYQDKSVCKLI